MDEYRKYEPIFGSWYLKKLIGKGSFGKVYEITREEFGTTYRSALKIITVPQDDDDVKSRMSASRDIRSVSEYYEGILKEIVNENEIMSQLKGNSNIVSYEDHQIIPHDDGIGYDILIRMELLTPLLDRMLERPLTQEEVVKLGIDICKALEVCHRKNIIHRDIKPQNIFISDNGDFKLGDFGIARTIEKTTGGMSKKGTYKYMAPEVFRGENYDSTVDIYSLGIVLYSLLNGNRGPFLPAPPARVTHNDEEEARMRRFRGEAFPPPRDASPMLAQIIQKASAADPRMRYQTAERMRHDLESYLSYYREAPTEPVIIPPRTPSSPVQPAPKQSGNKSAIIVVSICLTIAVIAIAAAAVIITGRGDSSTGTAETGGGSAEVVETVTDEPAVAEDTPVTEEPINEYGFIKNHTYTVISPEGVAVRSTPERLKKRANQIKRDDLSDEYKAQAEGKSGDYASLKKGAKVQCLDMSGEWMRITDGWICTYFEGEKLVE
jgi:serine/threonine protein kinase